MSLAVAGLRDLKNILHASVHRLHVSVGRARLTFRPIDSQSSSEEDGRDSQMRKNISRHHDAQRLVQSVCAEHGAFFDATSGKRNTRAIVGTHVDEVTRLLALEERSNEGRRAATVQKDVQAIAEASATLPLMASERTRRLIHSPGSDR